MTQGEIRSFRVRLYSGFLTETQVSPNGNLSNRCGKHLCMLHFGKTVWSHGNALLELRDIGDGEDIVNQMPGTASNTQTDSEIANVSFKCRF